MCIHNAMYPFCASWRPAGAHKGSGRAAVFALTQLPLIFTLECNFDSGVNVSRRPLRHDNGAAAAAAATADPVGAISATLDPRGRMSPEPTAEEQAALEGEDAKYTPAAWREVGQSIALATLDMSGANPASRLGPPGGDGLQRMRAEAKWFCQYAENAEDDEG